MAKEIAHFKHYKIIDNVRCCLNTTEKCDGKCNRCEDGKSICHSVIEIRLRRDVNINTLACSDCGEVSPCIFHADFAVKSFLDVTHIDNIRFIYSEESDPLKRGCTCSTQRGRPRMKQKETLFFPVHFIQHSSFDSQSTPNSLLQTMGMGPTHVCIHIICHTFDAPTPPHLSHPRLHCSSFTHLDFLFFLFLFNCSCRTS
jgi:hypothetical protein